MFFCVDKICFDLRGWWRRRWCDRWYDDGRFRVDLDSDGACAIQHAGPMSQQANRRTDQTDQTDRSITPTHDKGEGRSRRKGKRILRGLHDSPLTLLADIIIYHHHTHRVRQHSAFAASCMCCIPARRMCLLSASILEICGGRLLPCSAIPPVVNTSVLNRQQAVKQQLDS